MKYTIYLMHGATVEDLVTLFTSGANVGKRVMKAKKAASINLIACGCKALYLYLQIVGNYPLNQQT